MISALNNKNLSISIVAGLLFSVITVCSAAAANDPRDVVRDEKGHVVTITSGSCVRTKWDIGNDPCTPQIVKKAAEKHIKKARQLAKEERTVYFDFNHALITPDEQKKLDSLAEVLKNDSEVRDVRIAGYADRIGSVSYNKALSRQRAKNVESYLHMRNYFHTKLVQIRWLGKSEPVTHCPDNLKRTALIACLQKDRRVVVEIDYYPPQVKPAGN